MDRREEGKIRFANNFYSKGNDMKKSLVVFAMVMTLFLSNGYAQDGTQAESADVTTTENKAPEAVAPGVKVKMDYTLTVDGEQIETSQGEAPLEYTQGSGMIIPGLEKALEGMKVGETKKVTVKPEEGYGPVIPEMIVDLPKDKLAEGVVPEKDMILQFPTQDGNMIIGRVVEVMENDIKVDFNHPLAGKELTFDIKIVGLE